MNLKFRAWDKENSTMLTWEQLKSEAWFSWFADENLVFMQSTGVKDKNGVEIYAGNIIKERGGLTPFIEFDEEDLSFKSVDRHCRKLYVPKGYLNKYAEVIGNIYENPELMEVEE